jgi:hypothetical protein
MVVCYFSSALAWWQVCSPLDAVRMYGVWGHLWDSAAFGSCRWMSVAVLRALLIMVVGGARCSTCSLLGESPGI